MQERAAPARVVRFGAYLVDLRAGELHKNGHRIRLPEQPFQVLSMLLEGPGEVVTRDELQKRLWPADTFVDFDHGLNNAIKKLRDVLDDSAESPRYIETLPKRGYRFIAAVERAQEEVRPPAKEAAGPFDFAQGKRRRYKVVSALGVIAVATVLVTNLGGLRDRLFNPGPREPIRSIAVLPLENLTGDPEQEYLVDGIHDELITELAQLGPLSVPSRTTVMHYKQNKKPMAEIARELGVDAIIEGSVKRTGNRVRITIQLIHAPTDRHISAEAFERDWRELVILPGQVARAVVGQLRLQLTPQQQARLGDPQSVHPEAYEAYLLGRHYFLMGTPDGRSKAREFFEQAIRKDSGFARAYAGMAELYAMGGGRLVKDHLEGRANARKWAAKALELDDTLAEAHTALAWAELADWDWEGAEREFRRAIELNPNYALARIRFGWFLVGMQRFPEALEEVRRARQLDPVSPPITNAAAWAYMGLGNVDEGIRCVQTVLEREPDHPGSLMTLGFALLVKGEFQQALAVLEKASPSAEDAFPLGMQSYAQAKLGRHDQARKIASQLERRKSNGENVPPLAIAYAYVGLGDRDRALTWLEKDYQEHRWMWTLAVNPLLQPLHSDWRFADLLRRLRLPVPSTVKPGR